MINKNKKSFLLFRIIFIIIYFLIYKNNIVSNIKIIFSFIKLKNEFKRNQNYLKVLSKNKIIIINKIRKICKPKVSIISPIYNRERFILRFLKNIQFQSFNDIEIILIDDFSIDNSVKLIEEYKKIDERIILIKNKVNKGTFISRNIGVLYSNSKYVILPDPDDILNKDIIYFCYKYAEKYNYEAIRFNIHKKNGKKEFNEMIQKDETKEIYQPELSTYMFYGNKELWIIDYYIHNKFIQKNVFMKALNSLNKFYSNMYITLWEDTIMAYILYRVAKSLCSIKKIGYFYVKNSQSITRNMFKISELRIKFVLIFLKIVFEYSKNTKYEKDMFNQLFSELTHNFNLANKLSTLGFKSNFRFYYDIIIMFYNCGFINEINKKLLKYLLFIIKKDFMKENK